MPTRVSPQRRPERRIFIGSLILLTGVFAGCGRTAPQRGARINGTVTVGGKPAVRAAVRFFDEKNVCVGAGTVGDDGTYVAVDVPRKPLKVAVEEAPKESYVPVPPGTVTVPGTILGPPAKIPKKYQKTDTSGLTLTVADGEKEKKLDLSLE